MLQVGGRSDGVGGFVGKIQFAPSGCPSRVRSGVRGCEGRNCGLPPHGMLHAPRRVRNVHRDTGVGATLLGRVTRGVHRKVSARRVSHLICSFAASRKTVPTPLGCRKFPGDIYADVGSMIYRKVPDSARVLGDKSVVGMSISAVCGNCFSSTSHVFVVNRIDPRGRELMRIAGRYVRVNVTTTRP